MQNLTYINTLDETYNLDVYGTTFNIKVHENSLQKNVEFMCNMTALNLINANGYYFNTNLSKYGFDLNFFEISVKCSLHTLNVSCTTNVENLNIVVLNGDKNTQVPLLIHGSAVFFK